MVLLQTVFALDPMLVGGVDLVDVLIVLLKVVLAFTFLLIATMFMVWFERKVISDMQNRIGPSLAGPFGILQTMADGAKFLFKEDLIPDKASRKVFILAPFLSVVPAFLLFCIIPVGGDFNNGNNGVVTIFGHDTLLQVSDPQIGILFALAMSSVAVYGIMLAGWSSGSKYPLLGAVRASAQMISYEAAIGLIVAMVVLKTGTLSTNGMVSFQAGAGPGGWLPNWAIILTGIVPFFLFIISATAELNRPPFDLVEAEQELVGGFNTEYSSFRFALFFLAEFMNTITMSAIMVTLFLGGPSGPAFFGPGWMWGFIWFFLKLFLFLYMFVLFRATFPRVRYDQLMDLGWKVLIPLSLGWFLLLAALAVASDQNWNPVIIVGLAVAVFLLGYALIRGAIATARSKHVSPDAVGRLD